MNEYTVQYIVLHPRSDVRHQLTVQAENRGEAIIVARDFLWREFPHATEISVTDAWPARIG